MEKERALVMEIQGRRAVVLTAGGDFRRYKRDRTWVLGQEVEINRLPEASAPLGVRVAGLAAAVCVLVAIGVTHPWVSYSGTPAAYVSVDFAPSVRLSVNAQGEVLGATALNRQGEGLLGKVAVAARSLPDAMRAITEGAAKLGMIKPGSSPVMLLAVSSAGSHAKPSTLLERDVHAAQRISVKTADHSGVHLRGIAVQVSSKVAGAAAEKGLSAGRYALYLEAKRLGVSLSLHELRRGLAVALAHKHLNLASLVKSLAGDPRFALQAQPAQAKVQGSGLSQQNQEYKNGETSSKAKGHEQNQKAGQPTPGSKEHGVGTGFITPGATTERGHVEGHKSGGVLTPTGQGDLKGSNQDHNKSKGEGQDQQGLLGPGGSVSVGSSSGQSGIKVTSRVVLPVVAGTAQIKIEGQDKVHVIGPQGLRHLVRDHGNTSERKREGVQQSDIAPARAGPITTYIGTQLPSMLRHEWQKAAGQEGRSKKESHHSSHARDGTGNARSLLPIAPGLTSPVTSPASPRTGGSHQDQAHVKASKGTSDGSGSSDQGQGLTGPLSPSVLPTNGSQPKGDHGAGKKTKKLTDKVGSISAVPSDGLQGPSH